MRNMFAKSPATLYTEQLQKLYRLLHEVLLASGRSEEAGLVMVELLGTFTTENASQAREEAQRCIIEFLAGELIHDLLNIFVFEKLEVYTKFYEGHKEFVNGLGLKHEDNTRKMKLLSFMQLAENRSEISFAEIQQSIQIQEDEVEEFLIDVIKTKLVSKDCAG